MDFGMYSYIATVLIFCGAALLIYFTGLIFRKKSALFSASDWKAVAWTIIIMTIITAPEEWIALKWQIWEYNPDRTFHTTFFGAEVETYLFIIFVSLVVSIATLVYAKREDRHRDKLV